MMTRLQHESYGVNKIYDCQAKGMSLLNQHAKQHVIVVGLGSRGAYFLYPPLSLSPCQPLAFSSGGGGNGASQRERFLLSPIFLCHKI